MFTERSQTAIGHQLGSATSGWPSLTQRQNWPLASFSRRSCSDSPPSIVQLQLSGRTGQSMLCPVRPDNCSWTIEGGESLQLLLEKEASGQFWRCVSDGHPEVALPSWWPIAV